MRCCKGAWVAKTFKIAAGAPALLLFFGMLLVPDTPNSLAERDRPDQARRVLERIRGTSKVEAEMKSIAAAVVKGNKVIGTTSQPVLSGRYSTGREDQHNPAVTMERCQRALHIVEPHMEARCRMECFTSLERWCELRLLQDGVIKGQQDLYWLSLVQASNPWRLLFSRGLRPGLVISISVAFFSQINVSLASQAMFRVFLTSCWLWGN